MTLSDKSQCFNRRDKLDSTSQGFIFVGGEGGGREQSSLKHHYLGILGACPREKILNSLRLQCNQAREQTFFISPIFAHKIQSIIDKSLKFGTNLLQHKLYIEFKLWDVTMITSIFMAS